MSMRSVKYTVLSALFFPCLCMSSQIHYMTEEYPPYNFTNNGKLSGISIDILSAMHEKMNITDPKVNSYPWARGYKLAQMPGKNNVIFSTTRTEEREPKFKWVGPITKTQVSIFCNKDVEADITSHDDLADYNFAVIRDDIGHLELKNRNVPESSIQDVNSFDMMVKLVSLKRKDCFAYEANVTGYLMKKHGFEMTSFDKVYNIVEGELYYAFNKSVDDEVVEEHQDAIDKVKSDKALVNSINLKYGISD